LIDLNICRTNSTRIITSIYENEESIKTRGFFNHYLFQLKFVLAIQLCKVLDDNKNQKRNINKLLRRLESENWNLELINEVDSNTIVNEPRKQNVLKEVKLIKDAIESKGDLIKSIVKVRNQNYAHFDPTRDKSGPSVKTYEDAVVFTSDIYNRLSLVMFGNTTAFNEVEDWEIDPILKSMSKELTERLNDRKIRFSKTTPTN